MEILKNKTRLPETALSFFLLLALVAVIRPIPADGDDEVMAGFQRDDFVKIAEAGIDDPMNNYAWSMTELDGDIYVGTARNFLYMVLQALKELGILPEGYEYSHITHSEGEMWSLEQAEDNCGEIWRYRGGLWERVYRSVPVDVSDLPGVPEGAMAAKEPGFRYMITYTDKWGERAVYAASGTSIVPGRLLLKSANGTDWDELDTPSEIFGSDSRSMAVHNEKLYIGPAGFGPSATVWATDDPAGARGADNWQMVGDFTDEGPGTNVAVVSMISFNGYLYAGTQNDEAGFQVWRSDARSPEAPQFGAWTKIIDHGAGDMASTRALTMTIFKENLYVGTSMFPLYPESPWILLPKGFELLRIGTDDTWELLIGDRIARKRPEGCSIIREPMSEYRGGFGNVFNIYCWAMQAFDGVLYLGTFDMNSVLYYLLSGADPDDSMIGTDLWKTEDGIHWEPITLNGFDNPGNYGVRAMLATDSLFLGTANPFGGLDVLQAPRPRFSDSDQFSDPDSSCGACVTYGPSTDPDVIQLVLTGLLYILPWMGFLYTQRRRLRGL
ncbi:hypothetical protein ACFL4G_07995 [Thermodesulfobacteriota bacterium]